MAINTDIKQCSNTVSWPHYMCLGYSDSWIRGIRTGVVTVLCPCPIKHKTQHTQVNFKDDVYDNNNSNSDEDDEEITKLSPVISLHKPPMKAMRKRKKCCMSGPKDNNRKKCTKHDDEDEKDDTKRNEEESELHDRIKQCKEINQDVCEEKWCPKDPIDYSDDEVLAEEKHQYCERKRHEKEEFTNKKTTPRPYHLKRGGDTLDLMKHRDAPYDESERMTLKSASIRSDSEDFSESLTEPRKTLDQSVIEALENICFTAKQLHIQIRDLMCKMLYKSK